MADGYAEGIALDTQGNLSEGSGQNVFVVRDGIIYTPPIGNSVLSGITRDSVVTIAGDLGFEVREQTLPREMLYIADEVFFVGTAVEVTPIRSVDRDQGRPRPARPDHRGHPAALLPDRQGRGAGHARLAAAVDTAARPLLPAPQRAIIELEAAQPLRSGLPRWPGHDVAVRLQPDCPARRPGAMHVNDLLKIAVDSGASDLHLQGRQLSR